MRNPLDAFVSFHKFLPAYMALRPGDLTMTQFADAIFAGASQAGQIWVHFLGWWEQRKNPDVLWVFFEDLKDNLPGCVELVAEFLRIDTDAALLAKVTEQASFGFMAAAQNKSHFDDHFVREQTGPKMGLTPEQIADSG